MKFSSVIFFAGSALAYANTTTTVLVSSIVTYCPEPTTLTHGTQTFTVTKATTLTIPCPNLCTVTKPVIHTPVVECKTCNATKPGAEKPQPPAPSPTGGLKPSQPPVVAGAAKLSGAGLAAVIGAAILL